MKFYKETINSVPLAHETVLLRVDYNLPLTEDGKIADDFRIRASLPTIRRLKKEGCKLVIISHFGRPEGRDEKLSLEPVAARLAELLGEPVRFVDQIVGDKVKMAVKRAPKRSITVLENLRFDPREEANDEGFARELAEDSGARYLVQDAFGVAHRAHASLVAITQFLPSVAGLLLEREFTTITDAMESPKPPFVAVLGGAKVSDKIDVIKAFIRIADTIIIGGAMANNFFVYKGISVGKSKTEDDLSETIREIYKLAEEKVGKDNTDKFIVLPTDVATAKEKVPEAVREHKTLQSIADDDYVLDAGEKSIEKFTNIIEDARTVVWNGTLGIAELPNFAHGSARVALALATHPDITSIIGGGDTADFVLNWDARGGESFTLVSTGGGASLDLMAGKKLPGIESLLPARR